MRAVIYCRVSTKEQTENLSLKSQERACRDLCEREGLEVVRVFVEGGESAKTANRTELANLLHFCSSTRPRIDYVVVYRVDRFARNSLDHHKVRNVLLAFGTGLMSATEPLENTPVGKFIETLLAGVAQLDNDQRAERTILGMKEAHRRGRYTWVAPLGYLNSKDRTQPSLLVDPPSSELVRRAFEMAADGRWSKSEVLRRVSALGLRTKSGKAVTPQTFHSLLRNPVYVGRLKAQKWSEEHIGDWEPLASDEVFRRVQHWHFQRATKRKSRDNPAFPLGRFIRCAHCSRPLTGSISKGRTGRYPYYHCPKCVGASRVRTSKEVLERAFLDLLASLQPKPSYLRLFRAIVTDVWKSERTNAQSVRKAAEKRIEALNEQSEQLDRCFIFDRSIEKAAYQRQRDRLRAEITVAELELGDARFDELEVEGVLAFAEYVFGNLVALWTNANADDRRRIQEAVFPNGLAWDGKRVGTAVTIPAFSWLTAISAEGMNNPT